MGRQTRLEILHESLQHLHPRQQRGNRQLQPGILAFQLRDAEIFGVNGFDRSIGIFSQKMSSFPSGERLLFFALETFQCQNIFSADLTQRYDSKRKLPGLLG